MRHERGRRASRSDDRDRRRRLHGVVSLAVVSVMTVLLWFSSAEQGIRTLTRFGADTVVPATVSACPPVGDLRAQCTVQFGEGVTTTRTLTHAGLIGVSEGDRVDVWVGDQGTVTVAGWRPYADTAVLTLLACVFSRLLVRNRRRRSNADGGGAPTAGSGDHAGTAGPRLSAGLSLPTSGIPVQRRRRHPAA